MKKLIMLLFLLGFAAPLLAATVGGPDIAVPEESLWLRKEAINRTLDRYEYNMNIKASLEIEAIIKRGLTSTSEVTSAELEGQNYMLKISNNFYDVFEPYVKIGTSDLEVKWDQYGTNVKVDTNPDFAWAIGAKVKLWEFKNYGIKLTIDSQYKNIDLAIDEAKIGGSRLTASRKDEVFGVKEWQTALLASKKFIFAIERNDYYIVPYAGITFSSTDIDVAFKQSTSDTLYSVYNASDENVFGLVLGLDVMPFYLSYYLLNLELRLINETAISLGGTVKF